MADVFRLRRVGRRLVFQDGNARAHRARIVNAHLQPHNIYRMPWPAMSPDLSPIEHVWDMIGRRVRQRQRPPTTLAELDQALQEEWNRPPQMAIGRLIRLRDTVGMDAYEDAVILFEMKQLRYKRACDNAATLSALFSDTGAVYCNTTWDGFSCWHHTPANTLAVVSCPRDLLGVDPLQNATRQCHANGSWADRSDYHNCLPLQDNNNLLLEALTSKSDLGVRIIYNVGFILTTVSLLVALAIFLYFRSLRCLRNLIHSHLILTFILRNVVWIILHNTMLHLWNTDLEWICKLMVALYNYLHGTNFFWMFVEGLYLFTIIVWAYSADKIRLWYYLIIGWGIPFIYTGAWAIVKYNLDDFNCWFPSQTHYGFILHVPIFWVLVSNMFFLASIIWVLITKLKASPNIETRQYRKAVKATIILFPLLGVTYVLFLIPPSNNHVVHTVFQYANALLQSFQGLFVAVFYCFLNGEVKAVLRKKVSNIQESRSITSRYTKTSFIGSPARSSIRDPPSTSIAFTSINGKYNGSASMRNSGASRVIEEENML
ncbi:corticotropin-releasing factor receptor 1-like [Gigantopelta aegis]|uniref:corticotropin-releasing factor receptor 1-like n=1 Tax=Gigantopelta aegis TaxID=1735272 RepID=UPI001B88E78B|nr:corticotropin-releasing factor receptor 1-like [Gigantopelta aegis]